jgi:hypothetical protein
MAIKFSTSQSNTYQKVYDEVIKKTVAAIASLDQTEQDSIFNKLISLRNGLLDDLVDLEIHLFFAAFVGESYVSMINPFYRTAAIDGKLQQIPRNCKQTDVILTNSISFLAHFYKMAFSIVVEKEYVDPNETNLFHMLKTYKPDVDYFEDLVKSHLQQACLT